MITRRNAILTLITAASLLSISHISYAQKGEEKAIRAAYATADALYRKKDVAKLMKMLTPDVMYKEVGGKTMNYKEMDALMKQQLGNIQSIDAFKTTIKKLTVKGKTAQSETSMTLKGKVADPQGKIHVMTSMSTTRDTWTKTPQGWRMKMIEALSDKMLMDGKPMN